MTICLGLFKIGLIYLLSWYNCEEWLLSVKQVSRFGCHMVTLVELVLWLWDVPGNVWCISKKGYCWRPFMRVQHSWQSEATWPIGDNLIALTLHDSRDPRRYKPLGPKYKYFSLFFFDSIIDAPYSPSPLPQKMLMIPGDRGLEKGHSQVEGKT